MPAFAPVMPRTFDVRSMKPQLCDPFFASSFELVYARRYFATPPKIPYVQLLFAGDGIVHPGTGLPLSVLQYCMRKKNLSICGAYVTIVSQHRPSAPPGAGGGRERAAPLGG